jgi:hypothetical protein
VALRGDFHATSAGASVSARGVCSMMWGSASADRSITASESPPRTPSQPSGSVLVNPGPGCRCSSELLHPVLARRGSRTRRDGSLPPGIWFPEFFGTRSASFRKRQDLPPQRGRILVALRSDGPCFVRDTVAQALRSPLRPAPAGSCPRLSGVVAPSPAGKVSPLFGAGSSLPEAVLTGVRPPRQRGSGRRGTGFGRTSRRAGR